MTAIQDASSEVVQAAPNPLYEVVPIQIGPPSAVTVPATDRPELFFDEKEDEDVLEQIDALDAARELAVRESRTVLIGAHYRP